MTAVLTIGVGFIKYKLIILKPLMHLLMNFMAVFNSFYFKRVCYIIVQGMETYLETYFHLLCVLLKRGKPYTLYFYSLHRVFGIFKQQSIEQIKFFYCKR